MRKQFKYTDAWYALIYDEIWGKAEQSAVTLFIGPPTEAEGHQEEPGALQQCHLVIKVQVTEA